VREREKIQEMLRSLNSKILTLAIVIEGGKILLGWKKRGFGAGKWNGFGGHVEASEIIEEAAKRELLEEAGIHAEKYEKSGILKFEFEGNPEELEVHVFRITAYSGKPAESEEMLPRWFAIDDMPYGKMWQDDKYWMPLFLKGQKFKGSFLFDEHEEIVDYELHDIENFD
jgi:8-oxo-dGTP diphosphatase / 2-hydroxy-dATP diphosphatase